MSKRGSVTTTFARTATATTVATRITITTMMAVMAVISGQSSWEQECCADLTL